MHMIQLDSCTPSLGSMITAVRKRILPSTGPSSLVLLYSQSRPSDTAPVPSTDESSALWLMISWWRITMLSYCRSADLLSHQFSTQIQADVGAWHMSPKDSYATGISTWSGAPLFQTSNHDKPSCAWRSRLIRKLHVQGCYWATHAQLTLKLLTAPASIDLEVPLLWVNTNVKLLFGRLELIRLPLLDNTILLWYTLVWLILILLRRIIKVSNHKHRK